MSESIKANLKEISKDLNSIQTKKKELLKKFDVESKSKVFDEMKIIKEKIRKTVMDQLY